MRGLSKGRVSGPRTVLSVLAYEGDGGEAGAGSGSDAWGGPLADPANLREE
jgi:hypothetical protein